MIESLSSALQDFSGNVRIVDFLDIFFIAVFLYLILNWLWKSASRRAIISMSLLLALYVLARATEMYMTEILIEGLFVLILISIVVVFQSDIRRLIDLIGDWSFFWETKTTSTGAKVLDTITEAAAKLAESKTGALIVLKGNEEWSRHITGGVDLQGEVSLPLLLSIFDPKTAGHDGALLVEDGLITKFGTHLPLSTRLHKISRGGTRHAAALGLSERSDALVIVVSEERGVISVAQNGQLIELDASSDLKSHLTEFWQEHYEGKKAGLGHWWQMRSPYTALISVVIAVILWFAFAYTTENVYRTFSVPIEYRNLKSSNIVLRNSIPIEARVTLAGSEQAFQLFDPSELVISFDLGSTGSIGSDEFLITEQNINLPSDLTLYDVSPRLLDIEASRLVPANIPVKPSIQGELPARLSVMSISTDPQSVSVLAPEDEMPDSIPTEPVSLDSITESGKITRPLVLPPNIRIPEDGTDQVSVIIKVRPEEQ